MNGKIKKYFYQNKLKVVIIAAATVVFLVLVLFLDSHNMRGQLGYRAKISNLKEEKVYYQEKITEDSLRLHELQTNDKNLEKYAREKYQMKKKNEEIFLVKERK